MTSFPDARTAEEPEVLVAVTVGRGVHVGRQERVGALGRRAEPGRGEAEAVQNLSSASRAAARNTEGRRGPDRPKGVAATPGVEDRSGR